MCLVFFLFSERGAGVAFRGLTFRPPKLTFRYVAHRFWGARNDLSAGCVPKMFVFFEPVGEYYVNVVAVYVPVVVVKEHLYLFYEMPCLVELQYLEIKMIGAVSL